MCGCMLVCRPGPDCKVQNLKCFENESYDKQNKSFSIESTNLSFMQKVFDSLTENKLQQ